MITAVREVPELGGPDGRVQSTKGPRLWTVPGDRPSPERYLASEAL